MKPAYKSYLRCVQKALPTSGSQRKAFLDRFTISVQEYYSAHPDCTVDELCRTFGTAEEIADACMEDVDPGTISKGHTLQTRFLIALCAILAVSAVILCVFEYANYRINEKAINGYVHEVITELPSEVDPNPTIYETH